jgi:thiol-disulfide isomerase/thioredoxin
MNKPVSVDDGNFEQMVLQAEKPVLVDFWATWCYWCLVEMPYIQEICKEWSSKGLVVLAINTGESSSKAKEFLGSHGFSFPMMMDSGR